MRKMCAIAFVEKTIFSEAIERMLSGDPGLVIIPVSALDDASLFEALDHNRPDVLVLIDSTRILGQSILPQILQDYPGMCVITVDIDRNLMYVHPGRKLIQKPADLFSMIHSG